MNYTSRRAYFSQKTGSIQYQPLVISTTCHSERSEESDALATEILRFAQNDKPKTLSKTPVAVAQDGTGERKISLSNV